MVQGFEMKIKKMASSYRCMKFIQILLKYFSMTSKRAKKHRRFGRMNSLETPLERLKNIKKMYISTPMKNSIHVMMLLYLLHLSHQWFQEMNKKEQLPKEEGDYIEAL
jgi:hypothetical protein